MRACDAHLTKLSIVLREVKEVVSVISLSEKTNYPAKKMNKMNTKINCKTNLSNCKRNAIHFRKRLKVMNPQ